MPSVSAALGCSPTERSRSPNGYKTGDGDHDQENVHGIDEHVLLNRIGPITGISDRMGMGMTGKVPGLFSSWYSCKNLAEM